VLAFFAAALAASPPAPPNPAIPSSPSPAVESAPLESAVPWWEKITVTVDDKGTQHGCRYETSTSPTDAEACDAAMAASVKARPQGTSGVYTKLTFERRFSPDGRLDAGRLQPGDTLLGRQVMSLTIDAKGSILSCTVVATSGEATPDYSCDVARKEPFRAAANATPGTRQAFMTVLAYGHTERVA
jgi:hypothetical protein